MNLAQFQVFSDRVEELHRQWVLWRSLFLAEDTSAKDIEASQEKFRIVAAAAPQFGHCRAAMLRDVVLRLCQLGDPKKDGQGNTNLTIERILDRPGSTWI